jgi:hypothetical protein
LNNDGLDNDDQLAHAGMIGMDAGHSWKVHGQGAGIRILLGIHFDERLVIVEFLFGRQSIGDRRDGIKLRDIHGNKTEIVRTIPAAVLVRFVLVGSHRRGFLGRG